MVEVFLSKALICIMGVCHPALVGEDTPVGLFPLEPQPAAAKYQGEVLVFAYVDDFHRMSVHRPPTQRRRELLTKNATQRVDVSAGCINVSDEVYQILRDCVKCNTINIQE